MLWLYLLAFCRITIGLTFAYSFLMKVRDVNQFAKTIANFKLVPLRWERLLALLFLSGEAVVVILLLLGGVWLPLAFTLALILLAAFTVALVAVLVRNIQTTCNCFGSSQTPVTYADAWRNVGLLLLTAISWWAACMMSEVDVTLDPAELFLITIVAAIFILLWTNLRDIVALFQAA